MFSLFLEGATADKRSRQRWWLGWMVGARRRWSERSGDEQSRAIQGLGLSLTFSNAADDREIYRAEF
ncbi:MAG: hypothetical protein ACFB4I_24385 [Cyanophyceae cyanobacterium]